jgi:hypothetical protein
MRAEFTIDASGGKHWLARQLNVPIIRHSRRLVARYQYSNTPPRNPERLPRIQADSGYWTWTADLGGRYVSMLVSESGTGTDVTWRLAAQTMGPGWFMCGDAAAVLDPSSSHGVLRAIMSGIMAAHIAVNQPDAAAAYHEWMSDWFHHDKEKMSEAYREADLFGYCRVGQAVSPVQRLFYK